MFAEMKNLFSKFCYTATFVAMTCSYASSAESEQDTVRSTPNIVLIFADDLGYGDVGCFGATNWKTPNLDRMASEGIRFTSFLVSQPVCSASRASLLTGCYANRVGIHAALMPTAKNGINAEETTIAEMLRDRGYRTAMVGKWHLGHHRKFLPLQHGFDSYLGLPYSNDMWPHGSIAKPGNYPALPLIDGNDVIDNDVDADDQSKLTEKYLERSLSVIREKSTKPFFLYFAHTFPHVPLYVGEKHRGRSNEGGVYGDVIEEFDDAVGKILDELDRQQIAKETLVVFTSDNGPWLTYGNHGGSAGALREGKGTVFEGGVRVPFIARWPRVIPAGVEQAQPAMTIDVLPTIAKLTSSKLPGAKIDGKDISSLLLAQPNSKSPHDAYFHYYGVNELRAVRSGEWKLVLPQTAYAITGGNKGADGKPGKYFPLIIESPLLFNLDKDLSERNDLSATEPATLKRMLELAEIAKADLGDALSKQEGTGRRQAGMAD